MKKISEKQFVLDCINKEFELIGSEKRFDTFEALSQYTKDNPQWFDDNVFPSPEIEIIWREYCLKHFYDWQPKRISKQIAKENIGWLSLNWGFRTDYGDKEK